MGGSPELKEFEAILRTIIEPSQNKEKARVWLSSRAFT